MTLLDLDELPELFDRHPLYSARRPAPARFRRSDYLGDPDVPLAESARRLVEERTGRRPDGPVRLLTHLRYLGHSFNPVSFYYLYDRAGERVDAVIAEVTNIPWRERHAYVVERSEGSGPIRGRVAKRLHVSPVHGDGAGLRLADRPSPAMPCASGSPTSNGAGGSSTQPSTMRRRELSPALMTRVLLTYPPMSLAVPAADLRERAAAEAQGSALSPAAASRRTPGAMIDRAARAAVHALLGRIRSGRLDLRRGAGAASASPLARRTRG